MYKVREKVRELATPDYDINVWADNEGYEAGGVVNLTFYWLKYPGDDDYPDTGHEFPIADTRRYHTLKVPVMYRGGRVGEAIRYLDTLITNSSNDYGEFDTENMDWWSSEVVLENPPAFIKQFMDVLPRREQ